jgi:hypothetical protein
MGFDGLPRSDSGVAVWVLGLTCINEIENEEYIESVHDLIDKLWIVSGSI